ncbi:uncharacterized protein RCC_00974 [Ramularia collo-cygni]|uniref:RAVE subunit 2/Rogdi n=1 Tax=Ramularia collo-cygni TaxID=112498 RepID=A0A2D3V0N7_9PEZI|nr:uncharacterized protein RCC_00974 [Ramularia collo-cygni]CZT15069.1 uncharacterized protein RCC_00974 [Ramularia collo-cygni]
MSTLIFPPIAAEQVHDEEAQVLARELSWLLTCLQTTLRSLKSGLEECASLLAPAEPGSTLPLSSLRSEHLKGFITRVGTRIVKGDIHLRLPSLPPPKGAGSVKLSISTLPTAPTLTLPQLAQCRTLINSCLDVVDATLWTGDKENADFVSGQLQLLHENIQEAKDALKGWTKGQRAWNEEEVDVQAFNPPLPEHVSFHLSISEAAILLNIRVLEAATSTAGASASGAAASYSGLSLRDRLATAFGGAKPALNDEANEVFPWRGHDVRVREKVRVESQDPSLMAAMAKLGALERSIALERRALDVVMGRDGDGME